MHFEADSVVPLYQQIATQLEAGILSGAFPEGEQLPSTTALAREYRLNPATVLRGFNILVAAGLIEKRRGIGMFVTAGAQQKLAAAAQAELTSGQVQELVAAAKAAGLSKQAVLAAIEKEWDHD